MEASDRRVADYAAMHNRGRPVCRTRRTAASPLGGRHLVILFVAAVLLGIAAALSVNFAPKAESEPVLSVPFPSPISNPEKHSILLLPAVPTILFVLIFGLPLAADPNWQ